MLMGLRLGNVESGKEWGGWGKVEMRGDWNWEKGIRIGMKTEKRELE